MRSRASGATLTGAKAEAAQETSTGAAGDAGEDAEGGGDDVGDDGGVGAGAGGLIVGAGEVDEAVDHGPAALGEELEVLGVALMLFVEDAGEAEQLGVELEGAEQVAGVVGEALGVGERGEGVGTRGVAAAAGAEGDDVAGDGAGVVGAGVIEASVGGGVALRSLHGGGTPFSILLFPSAGTHFCNHLKCQTGTKVLSGTG